MIIIYCHLILRILAKNSILISLTLQVPIRFNVVHLVDQGIKFTALFYLGDVGWLKELEKKLNIHFLCGDHQVFNFSYVCFTSKQTKEKDMGSI